MLRELDAVHTTQLPTKECRQNSYTSRISCFQKTSRCSGKSCMCQMGQCTNTMYKLAGQSHQNPRRHLSRENAAPLRLCASCRPALHLDATLQLKEENVEREPGTFAQALASWDLGTLRHARLVQRFHGRATAFTRRASSPSSGTCYKETGQQ